MWGRDVPWDLFRPAGAAASPEVLRVMNGSLEAVRRRAAEGTLYEPAAKSVPRHSRNWRPLDTGDCWWNHGMEAPGLLSQLAPFLMEMTAIEPTVAGLASVHGCIGAVHPVQAFGTEEQKSRFLPKLASGERLVGLRLDGALRRHRFDGPADDRPTPRDHYVVNGEKLFITNVLPGGRSGWSV